MTGGTESNPEGVCEAQDLRGDSRILFEIPTLRVALRVRFAIKLLAQDDAQRHYFAVIFLKIKNIVFALGFDFTKNLFIIYSSVTAKAVPPSLTREG